MNKLQFLFATAGLALAAAATAQTESQTAPAQQQGAQQPQQQPAPGTESPAPSTDPAEGTAADTTPPGATPTTAPPQTPGTQNPAPATSPTEGTAADTTPPPGQSAGTAGQQDATRLAASGSTSGRSASQMIGATVQGTQGDTVGTVVDILFDQSGQATTIMIAPSGSSTSAQSSSIPWSAVQSMGSDGKLVIDSSRVQARPTQQ